MSGKWFIRTPFDDAVREVMEFTLKVGEAILLCALFGYAAKKLGSFLPTAAYHVVLWVCAAYVGSRSSLVVSGLTRRGKEWKRWQDYVVYPVGAIVGFSFVYFVAKLLEALIGSDVY